MSFRNSCRASVVCSTAAAAAAGSLGFVDQLGRTGEGLGLLEQLDPGFLELLVHELRGVRVEPESVEYLSDLLETKEPEFLAAHDECPQLPIVLEYAQLLRRHPPPVFFLATLARRCRQRAGESLCQFRDNARYC